MGEQCTKTVREERTGIRWYFTTMLQDLDFVDDIALQSSTMNHLQSKTTKLEDNSAKVGMKLNAKKCKVMKINNKSESSLIVGSSETEEVDSFTYLGANVTKDGILKVRWQQHISNKTVLEMTGAESISGEVRRRRWYWIGHVLRKDPTDDCVVALGWTSEGRRKRDRPKTTWRRMVKVKR
ncbi:uncharacterized protein LOC133188116 [Saccostrea echinata]|uniref:uncharacterized protein LOC133188116 n=1 Tax=Saccostrea echinata TaxID=191078 RepID=UPI002A80EA4E|nr:uncharacterized protein LOC133188116 [Saccostrea echinata]